jgi:hypothetical protein
MRFKGMTPNISIAHPIMGNRNIPVLLMNLKLLPRVRRVYMSRKLWWFETYTAGTSGGGRFSNLSYSILKNGATVSDAQILAIEN